MDGFITALAQGDVTAHVKSEEAIHATIERAMDYWIKAHRGKHWFVFNIDLNLTFNIMEEIDQTHYKTYKTSKFTERSFQGFTVERPLYIVETDDLTPAWILLAIKCQPATKHTRILELRHDGW